MDIITKLPNELREIIWNYISINVKVWLSKNMYERYHTDIILPTIPEIHTYIIYLVKNKHNYVFNIIYREKREAWNRRRRIHYKRNVYMSFNDLLAARAEEYSNHEIMYLVKNKESREIKKKVIWRKK